MKTNKTAMWMTIGGLLVVAAACSKSEDAAPPAREGDMGAKMVTPQRATEPPVQEAANAGADAAKPNLAGEPAAKVGEPAAVPAVPATPVTPVAPAAPPTGTGAKKVDAASAGTTGVAGLVGQATSDLSSLSQDQMVEGLREALGKGLEQAVAQLGREGGYLSNPSVKIPMPEKLQKFESLLHTMKQDKLADDFVATMNHAAEQAVPKAARVFAGALKQMTIADGKAILSGADDAATQYFQKATQADLYAKFLPIVQKATETAGVTGAYKKLMAKVNVSDISQKLGGLGSALGSAVPDKDLTDIDAYVTNKSMEGLFKMVAEEEKTIRKNPVARTTDLLQQVFGAVKK